MAASPSNRERAEAAQHHRIARREMPSKGIQMSVEESLGFGFVDLQSLCEAIDEFGCVHADP